MCTKFGHTSAEELKELLENKKTDSTVMKSPPLNLTVKNASIKSFTASSTHTKQDI